MRRYIWDKIRILEQLGIFLSAEEYRRLWSLQNETEVDAFAHRMIMDTEPVDFEFDDDERTDEEWLSQKLHSI